MASMTVRLVSGRKIRASLLCMPQSSAPQPLSGNGSCRGGTEAANRAALGEVVVVGHGTPPF